MTTNRLQILALMLLTATVSAQTIYKSVDEDGTIIYSEEPPTPDAEPAELPPLTEVPAGPTVAPRPRSARTRGAAEDAGTFEITSPTDGETIWNTGGQLTLSVAVPAGFADAEIVFRLNGEEVGRGGRSVTVEGVSRGEYQVTAEIAGTRRQTAPITIYVKQQSAQNAAANAAGQVGPGPTGGARLTQSGGDGN